MDDEEQEAVKGYLCRPRTTPFSIDVVESTEGTMMLRDRR